MSKNIDIAKSGDFKHSLDKEAGSRDAYLTISDNGCRRNNATIDVSATGVERRPVSEGDDEITSNHC